MSYFKLKLICLMLLILSSCSNESESRDSVYEEINSEFQNLDWKNTTRSVSTQKANLRGEIDPNAVNVRLAMAEFITTSESGTMGNTIFFSDRGNKQLSTDFVPFLSLDGTSDISFYVDNNRATQDVDVTVSNLAIDRAMQTWVN
ncbi:MAG: hypothetical protein KJO51_00840, partial [Gramella sp.]|nr:hypothetical protein [Christiangramia sp.]